ncbi:major facilitator superfamily transporter [Nocardia nova SH22a]|uniref:Major facilitator superfamily transporter n=1 Tax=Nocardia nova SH22a TaxID=1415166 RepID=W5TKB0_9NOCA|nr:MFS transporter [Nocardia nova]AHH19609.1 major facilitator superfamily transporter [Nocardia nova SH22a]
MDISQPDDTAQSTSWGGSIHRSDHRRRRPRPLGVRWARRPDSPDRGVFIGPVLVLATLVSSIISSFGAPLIPTVARDFHQSLSTAQWSLTVALLVGAVSSPVLGRLGDGPRRRATLLGGLAVVTAGGVVAAVAGDLAMLLVGRGLQGVGLGLAPLAMATARDELPRAQVPSMIALLSVSAGAGLGAGYPISGLIAGAWGLAGAYWFGAIVSGVALICVAVVVPSGAGRGAPDRLDWAGAALLAAALVTTLVAVAEGTAWGWGSPIVIGLLATGTVLFAVWAAHQLRAENPLVQLRLLRHPAVLAGDVCAMVLGVAMYMVLSGVTEFVQSPRSGGFGFSASAVVAGLVLIPLSFFMLISSRTLPILLARSGIRAVLTLGCLVSALGCGFFAVFHGALWQAFVMTGVLGVGLGTTFAAIPGVIVQAIPARETGSAMGFYQVVRFAGYSTGSALTATVLAAHVTGNGGPAVGGYVMVLWISCGICLAAAALCWFLPTRSPGRSGAAPVV